MIASARARRTNTAYEVIWYRARLEFPPEFPNHPPTMTFLSEIWHPNGACVCVRGDKKPVNATYLEHLRTCAVYEDGKVCISILHPPGEDRFNEQVRLHRFQRAFGSYTHE
jgi:ubiquitin-protein ligase